MSEELTLLKERAATLGIQHSPNIGVEALKTKIGQKLFDEKPTLPVVEDGVDTDEDTDEDTDVDAPELTPKQLKLAQNAERMKQRSEQLRLVRIRVTNLNPAKKALAGEIFTVANAFLGTVRKYIPYGEATDEGYHVPFILYNEMKDRKFVSIKKRKAPNGQEILDQRLVPEFALELLEPLTKDELATLARTQAAAAGL